MVDATDSAPQFLGLPNCNPESAHVRLLPLPYENTVSFGRGTAHAPDAILLASQQVELWDDELQFDLQTVSFHTAVPVIPQTGETPELYLARVEERCRLLSVSEGLTIGIGGAHSVTPPLVRAVVGSTDLSELTVVQFDAHADLREEYAGTKLSHACAMRRLVDGGADVLAIGIRSMSREEAEFARNHPRIRTFSAQALGTNSESECELLDDLRRLRGNVYLTIDVDVLDCALCPATGTPEPGGLGWWQSLKLLRTVLHETEHCRVLACDVVETVPLPGTQVNEFTAARLLSKIIAYAFGRGTV